MKKLLLLFVTIVLFTSCKDFKEISISSINNFKVNKMDLKSIEGEINVTISNPNNTSFKVYKSKANVLIGGTKIGVARIKKKVKIAANSSVDYTFVLQGDLKGINFGSIANIMSGRPAVEVNGYLKAGKWFYKKKFPIEQKQKISASNIKGLLPF